jgi:hypothetical protein
MFKLQFLAYDFFFSELSDKPVKNSSLERAEQTGMQQNTVIQTASLFFFKVYGIIFSAVFSLH